MAGFIAVLSMVLKLITLNRGSQLPSPNLVKQKENNMLDALFALINAKAGVGHMADILNTIEQLVGYCSTDYVADGNAKDAAIDSIVQVLQSHKSTALKK